jgi:hypothetical protein
VVHVTSHTRSERGVILVLTAIMLTVLLAFTALVIDLGNARQERRTLQNYADAAVLGAAQLLPDTASAEERALEIVAQNEPSTSFDWTGCSDDNSLDGSGSCISFNPESTRVRVQIPTMPVETLFAGAIGIDAVDVAAAATAQIRGGQGFGGIIPIWVPTGTGSGETCIKSDAPGSGAPACAGQQTGDFGTTGISLWKQNCSTAVQQMMRDNTANGADHDLSIYPDPNGVDDRSPCPVADDRTAHTLQTDRGNDVTGFTEGLVSTNPSHFIYGAPGRLHRGEWRTLTYLDDPYTGTSFSETIHASPDWSGLDDTPLWTFIQDDGILQLRDVPQSCFRSEFVARTTELRPAGPPPTFTGIWTQVSNVDWQKIRVAEQYRLCFADYAQGVGCLTAPCGGAVFDKNDNRLGADPVLDIQRTPRFGYVPTLGAPFGGGGSNRRPIEGFRAVYLDTIYIGQCGSNPTNGPFNEEWCLIWMPGPWDDFWSRNQIRNQISAQALTAYALHPGMLGADENGDDPVTVPRGSGGGEIEPIIELIE